MKNLLSVFVLSLLAFAVSAAENYRVVLTGFELKAGNVVTVWVDTPQKDVLLFNVTPEMVGDNGELNEVSWTLKNIPAGGYGVKIQVREEPLGDIIFETEGTVQINASK